MLDTLIDWLLLDVLRTARRRKIAAILLCYVSAVPIAFLAVAIAVRVFGWSEPVVHAAPAGEDNCTEVAHLGSIVTSYCEPQGSPPFYQNSVGFIAIAD